MRLRRHVARWWLAGLGLLVGCASGVPNVNPRGLGDSGHAGPHDAGAFPADAQAVRRDTGPVGPPDRDGDGAPDDVDCAPDDPSIGSVAELACASACAAGVSACADGVWGPCSATDDCDCALGATRELPCVRCGTQRQRCEEGRWVDEGACASAGPCAPGDRQTEGDETCGLGGERSRTCGDGCAFGPWACSAGTPVGLWALPSGATRWARYPLDASGSPFAPTEPIEAAFVLEERGEAYVLTRARYHVLRPSDRRWLRAGRRSDLFPEAGAEELHAAYAAPTRLTGGARPDVTLLTRDRSLIYPGFDAGTGVSGPPIVQACCTAQWSGPLAPRAPDVRAMWLDPDNTRRWPGSSHATCGPPEGFYLAVVSAPGRVHVQAPDCAFAFVDSVPFTAFSPFALPDAPSFGDTRAVFHLSGLFVLSNP